MKKIVAILMIVAMMFTLLVSCDSALKDEDLDDLPAEEEEENKKDKEDSKKKTEELLQKADEVLAKTAYKVIMKTSFKAEDKNLDAALAANAMEIPIIIDGENISMDMSMPALGVDRSTIVVVDKVLYMLVESNGNTVKYKCSLTQEQFEKFMAENNVTMPIEYKYFNEKKVKTDDDSKIISCSKLNQAGKNMLKERAKNLLQNMGNDSEPAYDEIELQLVVKDSKYVSQKIEMDYSITVQGQKFNISSITSSRYDYSEEYKVVLPEDADTYTEVDYGILFPG